jgi:hypothetical protein
MIFTSLRGMVSSKSKFTVPVLTLSPLLAPLLCNSLHWLDAAFSYFSHPRDRVGVTKSRLIEHVFPIIALQAPVNSAFEDFPESVSPVCQRGALRTLSAYGEAALSMGSSFCSIPALELLPKGAKREFAGLITRLVSWLGRGFSSKKCTRCSMFHAALLERTVA